jgi:hypothetical protein
MPSYINEKLSLAIFWITLTFFLAGSVYGLVKWWNTGEFVNSVKFFFGMLVVVFMLRGLFIHLQSKE